MYPLRVNYKPKGGVFQISFDDLLTIARMLNELEIVETEFGTKPEIVKPDQQGRGWKLSIPRGGGIDYDMILVGGRKYTPGTRTSNFLQINADGSSSWVAAMPDVMPTGSEIYDVTKNHIHLPGETAGNI